MKPGQFVNGRLETEVLRGVLSVPAGAVQPAEQGFFVLVAQPDGTLEQRGVTVRRTTVDTAVIASGLKAGEVVVTADQYTLKPGARVTVHLADRAAPAAPAVD